ncbi:MAG TPA: dihydrolipoamide acetyltransferase family protein [Actinomycetes bacterium]|jgi:pyruvate dehydrogenase E2 component (dihydrolipoamide acetyltransferase)|nr:dihydrolipoamide acetyltransferase family protein [Actinomycetes bacterium]
MPELLLMPEIATGTTEAVLSSWSVAENATVSAHDVVAVVETAKAVVDVEAEADGVMVRLLVAPGAEVATGSPIALVAGPGEQVGDVDAALRDLGVSAESVPSPSSSSGSPAVDGLEVPEAATTQDPSPVSPPNGVAVSEAPAAPATSSAAPESRNGHGARVFSSPIARRLAREAGLSVEQIHGTGPGGRIVRRDVERAVAEGADTTAPTTGPARPVASPADAARQPAGDPAYTEIPHTRLRRLIAARLTESVQTAPHFYLRASVRADRLLALRAELNAGAASEANVTVNDLVVKAVGAAHVRVPELNVTWTQEAVRFYASVDVAVAVATEGGLVTPVVRGVPDLSVTAVARSVRDLAERARSGRLQQHELEGGTISVTNLGMYGTEEFAAIISPPQASILAVGAAREEPVVVDGRLEVGTVMRLTLSVDHRPVDGVTAARWLAVLVDLLEHPARVLA